MHTLFEVYAWATLLLVCKVKSRALPGLHSAVKAKAGAIATPHWANPLWYIFMHIQPHVQLSWKMMWFLRIIGVVMFGTFK